MQPTETILNKFCRGPPRNPSFGKNAISGCRGEDVKLKMLMHDTRRTTTDNVQSQ